MLLLASPWRRLSINPASEVQVVFLETKIGKEQEARRKELQTAAGYGLEIARDLGVSVEGQ